jgi:hypothetical protein
MENKVKKPKPQKLVRIVIDLPVSMLEALDAEAARIGVARQALLKIWIAEKLNHDRNRS